MNLCNFAKVIISRCTKDASTIIWWNENACSSDDLTRNKYFTGEKLRINKIHPSFSFFF
jgi:hypothetical protein